ALALAMPTALTVASGAMARRGLVMTRSGAIEALAQATDVVFDKTGTLTAGEPRVAETLALGARDEPACRALAASLAQASSHPLDRALAECAPAEALRPVASHEAIAGEGIEGRVDGRRVRLG